MFSPAADVTSPASSWSRRCTVNPCSGSALKTSAGAMLGSASGLSMCKESWPSGARVLACAMKFPPSLMSETVMGSWPFGVTYVPSNGSVMLMVTRDLTELKELEVQHRNVSEADTRACAQLEERFRKQLEGQKRECAQIEALLQAGADRERIFAAERDEAGRTRTRPSPDPTARVGGATEPARRPGPRPALGSLTAS